MGQPWVVIYVHTSGECNYVIYDVSQNEINQSIEQSISQRSFILKENIPPFIVIFWFYKVWMQ